MEIMPYKHRKITNSTPFPPYLVSSTPIMHHSKGIKQTLKLELLAILIVTFGLMSKEQEFEKCIYVYALSNKALVYRFL